LLPSFVNLLATVMQVTAERHCLSNTGLGLAFLPYHFPYLSRAVGKEARKNGRETQKVTFFAHVTKGMFDFPKLL